MYSVQIEVQLTEFEYTDGLAHVPRYTASAQLDGDFTHCDSARLFNRLSVQYA
jgi:hypothetical protein